MSHTIQHQLRAFFCVTFFLYSPILPTVVIQGDPNAAAGQTFSFPIAVHTSDAAQTMVYTGAGTPGGAYSVAWLPHFSPSFMPLAVTPVTLNNVQNQISPVNNASIALLSLIENTPIGSSNNNPVVVLQNFPANAYLLYAVSTTQPGVLSAENIKDTSGVNVTSGVVALCGLYNYDLILAAVGPNGGSFGEPGGGIALLQVQVTAKSAPNEQGTNSVTKSYSLINIDSSSAPAPTVPVPRASPLDITTGTAGGNALASMSCNDIYWDPILNTFFIALNVVAGTGQTAVGVVIGSINKQNQISLSPIVALNAISGTNAIVATQGTGSPVSIAQVRTMFASTRLNYLIVVGGNVLPADSRRTVFALPLVANLNNANVNATLAANNAIPLNYFSLQSGNILFRGRAFTTQAATGTLFNSSDTLTQVGGATPFTTDITDISVEGDFVIVTLAGTTPDVQGTFYSQALFDVNGAINGWTAWQRMGGSIQTTFGISFDGQTALSTTLTGTSSTTVQTVNRTVWGLDNGDNLLGGTQSDGSDGLIALVNTTLPPASGGVQGLYDFPSTTAGLFNVSFLGMTGYKTFILAQSGQGDPLVPQTGSFNVDALRFNNGAITENLPAVGTTPTVLTITGGALDTIGALTSAEIAVANSTNGLLFVGGVNGVAVLTTAAGNGWNATTGLSANFNGLVSGMQFNMVGEYAFVRKILFDAPYLYVLTDTLLDRIDLDASSFGTNGILFKTTVAQVGDVSGIPTNSTLLDVIISQKLGVLGTSQGLFRVGDGNDISNPLVSSPQDLNWTPIPVPQGILPSLFLTPISPTGFARNLSQGGLIYLNNSYIGKDRGRLNRFTVADVSSSAIDDTTIQPTPDYFFGTSADQGINSYFLNFNNFKNIFTHDAGFLADSVNRNPATSASAYVLPFDRIIPPGLRACIPEFSNFANFIVPLNTDNPSAISAMVRDSASGAVLIAGNFGLRVNE